jgi:hypothetical protein
MHNNYDDVECNKKFKFKYLIEFYAAFFFFFCNLLFVLSPTIYTIIKNEENKIVR